MQKRTYNLLCIAYSRPILDLSEITARHIHSAILSILENPVNPVQLSTTVKPQNPAADQPDEQVSKSQRKRESKDVQALGSELTGLPQEQLESLPLPEQLLEAIVAARTMKQHGARKRQIKYIGGLLRALDIDPIRAALEEIHGQSARAAARHHRIERWRDRLLAEGDDALAALVNEYPAVDRQRIRQLIRTAHREAAAGKPPQAARSLFRALRDQLK